MTKEKKQKMKKNGIKVGIGFLAFASGAAATFFLVPNRVNVLKFEDPEPVVVKDTYFSRFVGKLTPLIGEETSEEDVSETEAFGLRADLTEVEINWPGNKLIVGGQINVNIKDLKNLDLTLDLDVNYNGKSIDLGVGYVDKTVYLACKDLKLKTSFVNDREANKEFVDMFKKIGSLFFDTENEEGMRIDFQIGEILGSLIGGLDLSSLGGGGLALNVEETEDDERAYSTLNVGIDENTNLEVALTINKQELSLEKVVLSPVKLGDIEIKAALACKTDPNLKVYGLDDPNYAYKQRGKFVETFHYTSWIDSIFNLLKTRTVGLDISASLAGADKTYGIVDAAIDLDASRFQPLDLVDLVIGPELFGLTPTEETEEMVEKSFIRSAEPATNGNSIIEMINNFDFNVGLKLSNMKEIEGQLQQVDYSNLSVAYFKDGDDINAGYITFNEENDNAVMKAKVEVSTINFLINEIPELINSLSKETVSEVKEEEEPGLFDFITSSTLVSAIEEGHFEGIIDMIETLKSTENTMEIAVNLSSLGFGDNAKVNLILDAGTAEQAPSKVLNIGLKNVKLGDLVLNANIATRKYNKLSLERVNEARHTYDKLDFLPGTFDQVEQILDTKQAAIKLEGSARDEAQLGFDFNGWAQLDYGEKNGMGHIQFDEYKYSPTKAQTPHTVDLSIDDFDGDHAKNNMYFEYRDSLKGRFTLKTFEDIINVVMKLINCPDTRFTKFLQPIIDKIMGSILVQAITNKDYLELTKSSLLKSVKQINNTSVEIVLSKELLMDFVPTDLVLRINFKYNSNNEKCLDSLEIVDLNALGKTINVKISLDEYVAGKENPVDLSDTSKFLDFSDIAVLLEFGINTTELTYFHLTGDVRLKFDLFNLPKWLSMLIPSLITLKLDFHIYVNGATTKVYGKMANNPIPTIDGPSELVFEPSNSEDDLIGGRFHIFRRENNLLKSDMEYYYASDSDNFVDNIIPYLLGDFLGLDSAIVKMVGDLDLSSKEELDPKYENIFTSTGFQYDPAKIQWKTGISIEAFLEKDTIAPVEATITGKYVDGMGYLSQIDAETTLAKILPITAKINLVDPDPKVKDWPSWVETRYQEIISIYDSLTSAEQASALNNPYGGYTRKV